MKGLTANVIPTRDIPVSDEVSFSVRGLSVSDILSIYRNHAGELGLWFDKMQVSAIAGDAEASTASIISDALSGIPDIAAEIIAYGSGSANEETVQLASQLATGVQMEALQAIADLTFTETMPPKKVLEIVINAARTAAVQVSEKA